MGCKIRPLPRSGYLALRLHWRCPGVGVVRTQERTGLSNTAANRALVDRDVVTPVAALMQAGIFDRAAYLRYFPGGARAAEFRAALNVPAGAPDPEPEPRSVIDYYRVWIERKRPPHVRMSRERDYRQHFTRYILPIIGDEAMHTLGLTHLIAVRDRMTAEELAPKTIRNVVSGSLRAMLREAKAEGVSQSYDLFDNLELAPGTGFNPDPFDAEERDAILRYFRDDLAGGRWYPFVLTLALTGMRPGEATAIHVREIDWNRGQVSIVRSKHMGIEYALPKTRRSIRTIPLRPEILDAWRPLVAGAAPSRPLFLNTRGLPLQQENWRADYWKPCLTALKIRERDLYALRDTFISLALSDGASSIAVAHYCGTSIGMIDQSYGRFVPRDQRGLTAFVRAPASAKTEPQDDPVPRPAGKARQSGASPTGFEPIGNRKATRRAMSENRNGYGTLLRVVGWQMREAL